jgi:pimeloyl-ACP methyl ester carboxylesterase
MAAAPGQTYNAAPAGRARASAQVGDPLDHGRQAGVPIDTALLRASSSFEAPELGLSERFVRLDTGAGGTLGTLSIPLSDPAQLGWVICHSFGAEQVDLMMTEVAIARRLAAAGFPVLRFHCQGYGDSDHATAQAGPASHLRDTSAIVERFPALAGVRRVGLIGARFGGTVAALVADQLQVSFLVLIAPILSGGRYMTELLRSRVMVEMLKGDDLASPDGGGTTVDALRQELAGAGIVNIKGLGLRREVYEEMNGLDLLERLSGFKGQALVIQVSRGAAPHGQLTQLVKRLGQLGAAASLTVVRDTFAPHFGIEHFQPVARDTLGDSLLGINNSVSGAIVDWARELPDELGALRESSGATP